MYDYAELAVTRVVNVDIVRRHVVAAHHVGDFVYPRDHVVVFQKAAGMSKRSGGTAHDVLVAVHVGKTADSASVPRHGEDNVRADAVAHFVDKLEPRLGRVLGAAKHGRNFLRLHVQRIDAHHAEPEVRVHVRWAEHLVHKRRRLGEEFVQRHVLRILDVFARRLVENIEYVDCIGRGRGKRTIYLVLPVRYDGTVLVVAVVDRPVGAPYGVVANIDGNRRLRPDFDALDRIGGGVHLGKSLGVSVVKRLRASPEVLREVADAKLRFARRGAPVVVGKQDLRRPSGRCRLAEHLHRAHAATRQERVVPVEHREIPCRRAMAQRRTVNAGGIPGVVVRRELDPARNRIVIRRDIVNAVVV